MKGAYDEYSSMRRRRLLSACREEIKRLLPDEGRDAQVQDQEPPYRPCDCTGDCVKWEEGNPNGCYGTAEAVEEEYWEDEDGGGWGWFHACKAHREQV